MKKVQVIIIPRDDKFVAVDQADEVYYTGKRKADVKRSVTKGSRADEFELVNGFAVEETKEEPKSAEPKKEDPKPTKVKKSNVYETYKEYIFTNFISEDLYSKSPKIANFCKKFDLKLNKAGRNLTFEKTLIRMMDEGVVEYKTKSTGKYQKLEYKYTKAHLAAMSPDEDEEL